MPARFIGTCKIGHVAKSFCDKRKRWTLRSTSKLLTSSGKEILEVDLVLCVSEPSFEQASLVDIHGFFVNGYLRGKDVLEMEVYDDAITERKSLPALRPVLDADGILLTKTHTSYPHCLVLDTQDESNPGPNVLVPWDRLSPDYLQSVSVQEPLHVSGLLQGFIYDSSNDVFPAYITTFIDICLRPSVPLSKPFLRGGQEQLSNTTSEEADAPSLTDSIYFDAGSLAGAQDEDLSDSTQAGRTVAEGYQGDSTPRPSPLHISTPLGRGVSSGAMGKVQWREGSEDLQDVSHKQSPHTTALTSSPIIPSKKRRNGGSEESHFSRRKYWR
ncbi:hypothetical protein FRC05_005944 [Tulasnella sp. 425]|nr:hypothetical protein FRC05_005944 [Tulasnella sp. 425]